MANITYRNIILQILIILILICCVSCVKKDKVANGVNIKEIKDPDWVEYDYFWQQGRNENGDDLFIVTIYWKKINKSGESTYMFDGKKWEEVK